MIAVSTNNTTFFFKTDRNSLEELYDHICELLEGSLGESELHELAGNVQAWAEFLAEDGDEYDELSDFGITIKCVENYTI